MSVTVDPARYEMFRHRLYYILEEGRIAIGMVSGSPIVVEGGESMCSFYDADGTAILTACGLLLHSTGCRDAILHALENYSQDPGIHDGDQFFYNDPYIAATHVYDMIVVKPIFADNELVAWVGTMMHTGDTGGVLRGSASEIFHEGIRFSGIKIVEDGKLRKDVFLNITQQCRDPNYVGLDLKAKVAANNVCARHYLGLVEKYGREFVQAAGKKIIADSESMARDKLKQLPDGVWRSRCYHFAAERGKKERRPFKIACAMTKTGDRLTFDLTGSSSQNQDHLNATRFCSWSGIFEALAATLFWDVPWNGGMVAPVELITPEASVVNCKFPAACGLGTVVAYLVTYVAHECISRLLYSAGLKDDVSASWRAYGVGTSQGWGGHNQHGGVIGQQLYEQFAGGTGATPYRDGVHTGGALRNPQAQMTDVELTEMTYPFLYFSRNHAVGSGGYGKFMGGMGLESLKVVYGTTDLSITGDAVQSGAMPGGWGLFGGYPSAMVESAMFETGGIGRFIATGVYPTTCRPDAGGRDLGKIYQPRGPFERVAVNQYELMLTRTSPGSGYGDYLQRDPLLVVRDVENEVISRDTADNIFGVIFGENGKVNLKATAAKRRQLNKERLAEATTPAKKAKPLAVDRTKPGVMIHESLELGIDGKHVRCVHCGASFGTVSENYKLYAARRTRPVPQDGNITPLRPDVVFQEYLCPGCGVLLQVDNWCPKLDGDEPLWDIEIKEKINGGNKRKRDHGTHR